MTFECPTTEEGVRIRLEWPSRVKSKKLAILNEDLDQLHRAQVTYIKQWPILFRPRSSGKHCLCLELRPQRPFRLLWTVKFYSSQIWNNNPYAICPSFACLTLSLYLGFRVFFCGVNLSGDLSKLGRDSPRGEPRIKLAIDTHDRDFSCNSMSSHRSPMSYKRAQHGLWTCGTKLNSETSEDGS